MGGTSSCVLWTPDSERSQTAGCRGRVNTGRIHADELHKLGITPRHAEGKRLPAGSKHRGGIVRAILADRYSEMCSAGRGHGLSGAREVERVYANAGWEFQRADLFPAVYGLAAEGVERASLDGSVAARRDQDDLEMPFWTSRCHLVSFS
ncbi:hypothetical protein FB45DRAFT_869120 [Roridomyces roridus]|uniref:Uncharacterized protein n=1 Tax=Roridomyces roridus TaxID=1738132 RepID=A0AAD7BNM2_9AGAR|nr:hypothetical protein FB45DRAFT_869120 [Roridomyces roridus]